MHVLPQSHQFFKTLRHQLI